MSDNKPAKRKTDQIKLTSKIDFSISCSDPAQSMKLTYIKKGTDALSNLENTNFFDNYYDVKDMNEKQFNASNPAEFLLMSRLQQNQDLCHWQYSLKNYANLLTVR